MKQFGSLKSFVRAELLSADVKALLDALSRDGLEVRNLTSEDALTVRLDVSRRDWNRLRTICEKRGDALRLIGREGLYWTALGLLRRPVLLLGILLYLFSALWLPGRVFFLRVEGNHTVPTRLILEQAQKCGVSFGASRREVRSERVKNALVEAIPELQWAGINTEGCVAVISVRERAVEAENAESSQFGHIVAIRDAVISQCTATRGSLLCAPGQAVSEGDILISGYTDCGLTIRAEQAEGEIYGMTRRELTVTTAPQRQLRTKKAGEHKKICLLIGKKRINLWKDSGIWDSTCDRMYEEYYITLPGGFQLPLAVTVERYTCWYTDVEGIPEEEAQHLLWSFGESYLLGQMVAGKIRSSQQTFLSEDDRTTMAGQYICVEMIGKMRRLQIGEQNGENY